jgi:hypothetical protein
MEIFTINGKLTEGAKVELCHMEDYGIIVPGIYVHSKSNIVPVILGSWDKLMLSSGKREDLRYAMVGTTSLGRPLLFKMDKKNTSDEVIVMFKTVMDDQAVASFKTLAHEPIVNETASNTQVLAIVGKDKPFLAVENGNEYLFCWTGEGFTKDFTKVIGSPEQSSMSATPGM